MIPISPPKIYIMFKCYYTCCWCWWWWV